MVCVGVVGAPMVSIDIIILIASVAFDFVPIFVRVVGILIIVTAASAVTAIGFIVSVGVYVVGVVPMVVGSVFDGGFVGVVCGGGACVIVKFLDMVELDDGDTHLDADVDLD